jgi:uncharacterized membrane protein
VNWLIKNFLRGLAIVVPIALTIYLVWQAFLALDQLLPMQRPGLGILILVAGTILLGALASNFFVRHFLRWTEAIFRRAPLVRIVYTSIKDLLEAFVGDKRRFDRPVTVALNEARDVRTLGFVTQDDLTFLALPGHVAVYVPFSYSVAGTLVIVPRDRVEQLDADAASVMALAVSGGVSRV